MLSLFCFLKWNCRMKIHNLFFYSYQKIRVFLYCFIFILNIISYLYSLFLLTWILIFILLAGALNFVRNGPRDVVLRHFAFCFLLCYLYCTSLFSLLQPYVAALNPIQNIEQNDEQKKNEVTWNIPVF